MISNIFVYGTLMPGGCRWPALAAWVDRSPKPDSVKGELFDTGYGYPAAVIGPNGRIPGFTVTLSPRSTSNALPTLDSIEGTSYGLYQRVAIVTENGARAWIYTWSRSTAGFAQISAWAHEGQAEKR